MNKAKFTGGKWKIQDDGYGLIGVLFKKGFGVLVGVKEREQIANAHLIAAAPEMYEMLEYLSDLDENQMHKKQMQDLLAEARGEQ